MTQDQESAAFEAPALAAATLAFDAELAPNGRAILAAQAAKDRT